MNVPLYVIRNDNEGNPILINKAENHNRNSALYHNIMKKSAFLLKGIENKPENFHVTGIIRMNAEMFELKKSNEDTAGKSVKKRKMGNYVFLKMTDYYAIELIQLNELKNHFIFAPDSKLNERPNRRRVQREVPEHNQLIDFSYDILIYIDFNEYLRIKEYMDRKNTLHPYEEDAKICDFYLLVINTLNLIFQHMENFSYKLRIYLKSIIILDTPEKNDFITQIPSYVNGSVNAEDLLSNFSNFDFGNIEYDHAVLFVGLDLYAVIQNQIQISVAGISYVGALCTKYSLSIVGSKFGFSVIHIMMHEIAHSLGSQHDGTNNNCSKESHYIMSQSRQVQPNTTNPWYFSSCSIKQIEEHLDDIIEQGSNCGEQTSMDCCNNNTAEITEHVYSLDEQCQIAFGNTSYIYRHNIYSQDVCKFILCVIPINGSTNAEVKPQISAPGTVCSSQKQCEQGDCIYSSKAPNISLPCLFGDKPRPIPSRNCSQLIEMIPQICGMDYFQEACVCSCSKHLTKDMCCPYGPETFTCLTSWCSNKSYDGFCCQTCPAYSNCSLGYSRRKRSNYFNTAMQKKAKLFLKSYLNLLTMKQNQEVDNYALEERQRDLTKCPLMTTGLFKYCNELVLTKSNSACYNEFISQICCQACILVMDKKSPGCEYGDSDEESCSQWAKEGQLASRCFTNKQVHEKICCKSCRLLVSTMYSGSKKNPISFPLIMMVLYACLVKI
ncbi:unnamed protein product [Acanthosepion pharaonis]|uniref:Peptidase M12B domain-containing protein n=1 Tax=Acanthosepion pharaonis TaxID=158019 RepID=A0A812BFK0_ACAPH|nr:unnamed protein product [Sepia pharaonis]